MRFTRLFTALFSILTLVGAATPTLVGAPTSTLAAMQPKDLVTALQHGGFVILLRTQIRIRRGKTAPHALPTTC